MIEALFGLAVEGVKSFLSSEMGHNAMHVAAHKAYHSIEHAIADNGKQKVQSHTHDHSQSRMTQSPKIIKCWNCGKDVSTESVTGKCWNCNARI